MVTKTQLPASVVAGEQTAIQKLLKKLVELYPDNIQRVILFGSKARGDFNADSDTDLLVLADRENWTLRNDIWKTAAHIELDYDLIFNIQLISIERWTQMSEERFSICRNVEREGITLFSRS